MIFPSAVKSLVPNKHLFFLLGVVLVPLASTQHDFIELWRNAYPQGLYFSVKFDWKLEVSSTL